MGNPISNVNWVEKNDILDALLNQEETVTIHPMEQGFEAEVIKISTAKESFVLKIWSKRSKPDIRFQFHVLNFLYEQGLSVSKPLGWGTHSNADQVLLTTFDGTPVLKLNEKKMVDMASLLSRIHQTYVEEAEHLQLPKYDFIGYFFPGITEHPDLYQALVPLVQIASIKQDRLIHGDFHLRNIVEDKERSTIIDWTNGQLGDPRYDFAWSLILKKIYISKRYADRFGSAYLSENDIPQEELEVFEALACLRWILLNRNGGTPKRPDTRQRVKQIIINNRFLKELEFKEMPIK